MCINYLNKFYIQNNIKYINKSIDFDLIYAIAKLFHYYEIIITHEFTSFIKESFLITLFMCNLDKFCMYEG